MTTSYGPAVAAGYDFEQEHRLAAGEGAVWVAEIARWRKERPSRVLDFGAGTGLLLAALKRAGFHVRGLEPSGAMIDAGIRRGDGLANEDFVQGDASDPAIFTAGAFDVIVARQVVCHLVEPEKVFAAWRYWLKPGGFCIVVDGLWPRSAWSLEEHAAQPFAALTDPEPLALALESSGFVPRRAELFTALNSVRQDEQGGVRTRYIVVAEAGGTH